MPTVRAFNAADRMADVNAERLDANQKIYFAHMASNRWLSLRLEFLGGILIVSAAVFGILNRDNLGPEVRPRLCCLRLLPLPPPPSS